MTFVKQETLGQITPIILIPQTQIKVMFIVIRLKGVYIPITIIKLK